MTPQEAQTAATELMQYMIENNLRDCMCCEASLSKSEHSLTKGMIVALMKFAEACLALKEREANPKKVIERHGYTLELDERSNWTKLRFFGLVAKYRVDGVHVGGKWVVTRNGWAFLRGELEVPKYIKTFRNHIVEKSIERVSMETIYGSQPYFPHREDFFHETVDGEDLNIVKESKFRKRKKKVKCKNCTVGVIKRRMTAQIVDGVAHPTFWNVCTSCGWKEQTI